MELFSNLIYEYKKGMRDLAMYTCKKEDYYLYVEHLHKNKIEFVMNDIGNNKVNLFFGNPDCLKILNQFSSDKLDELNANEDFILGIMLGYSRNEQYERLLKKKSGFGNLACSI